MSEFPPPPPIGSIVSADITVDDANRLRDFYTSVTGWGVVPMPMGDYDDYVMTQPDGTWVGGVCFRKGPNDYLPPVWLIHVRVENLDASLRAVIDGGGEVIGDIRGEGGYRMAVIKDPVGAHMGLVEITEPPVEAAAAAEAEEPSLTDPLLADDAEQELQAAPVAGA